MQDRIQVNKEYIDLMRDIKELLSALSDRLEQEPIWSHSLAHLVW